MTSSVTRPSLSASPSSYPEPISLPPRVRPQASTHSSGRTDDVERQQAPLLSPRLISQVTINGPRDTRPHVVLGFGAGFGIGVLFTGAVNRVFLDPSSFGVESACLPSPDAPRRMDQEDTAFGVVTATGFMIVAIACIAAVSAARYERPRSSAYRSAIMMIGYSLGAVGCVSGLALFHSSTLSSTMGSLYADVFKKERSRSERFALVFSALIISVLLGEFAQQRNNLRTRAVRPQDQHHVDPVIPGAVPQSRSSPEEDGI